jgi:large subunit ribosomal protein L6
MSRVGKNPIPIPPGAKIAIAGAQVSVEGPKGELSLTTRPGVHVKLDDAGQNVLVSRKSEERQVRALHGTTRALISNMIQGVTQGFEKQLEVVGVGYVCSLKGDKLSLRVGFANEVQIPVPKELNVTCPDQTHITVKGCDKQLVGQFTAAVRSARKPEPYKGKGVRYVGEHVKIKPGKAAG